MVKGNSIVHNDDGAKEFKFIQYIDGYDYLCGRLRVDYNIDYVSESLQLKCKCIRVNVHIRVHTFTQVFMTHTFGQFRIFNCIHGR